jgi:hypothetical protein
MPKPASVASNVSAWLREQHGDTVESWMRVATTTAVMGSTSTFSGSKGVTASRVFALLDEAGLSPAEAAGRLFGRVGAWVLSPTAFRVLRLSVWRERVKECVFEAPRSELEALRYRDHRAYGNELRAMILDLAGGRFLFETTHLGGKGKPGRFRPSVDRFFGSLGDLAQPI